MQSKREGYSIMTIKQRRKVVCRPKKRDSVSKRREEVMFECFKSNNRKIIHLLHTIAKQGEITMALLTEVQTNAVALQTAFAAEQARQNAKNAAFQTAIDGANATLVAVQAELDALKAGGQTPENQAVIDDINAKIVEVTNGLNAAAV
jgi:hypothetical protein